MKKEILRMQDVRVGEYEPYALDGFQLHICEGELVSVIGLSGAGKTMIYEYFLGHTPLKKGKVIYNGRVNGEGEVFSNVTDVVCIGRESTLIPGLTVAENIFIITGKRKVKGIVRMKDIYYRARILLGQYAPELSPHTLARELTPMQMRMVELLRAIENEAKLVVIDDVFQGYGQNDIFRLMQLMKNLKEKKIAILYESHETDFMKGMTDKIVILRKGKNVRTFFESDYDERLCRKMLMGTEELPVFARTRVSKERKVFRGWGLFGDIHIGGMNIEAHEGEIVGLYDLNNRRNMEIIRMIIGEHPLKRGAIYLEGQRFEPQNLDYAIANQIGYIPQNMTDVSLVETMNFMDNLCLPVLKRTSHLKIFRDRKLTHFLGSEYMERLGIPYEERQEKVQYFDAYIQTSILLTRWILFKPKLMVCMEPCGSADMIMRDIVFRALSEMAENGTAVLVASQNMNELKTICDTVYVMNSDEKAEFRKYEIEIP